VLVNIAQRFRRFFHEEQFFAEMYRATEGDPKEIQTCWSRPHQRLSHPSSQLPNTVWGHRRKLWPGKIAGILNCER
jgi:hypothetical protein